MLLPKIIRKIVSGHAHHGADSIFYACMRRTRECVEARAIREYLILVPEDVIGLIPK